MPFDLADREPPAPVQGRRGARLVAVAVLALGLLASLFGARALEVDRRERETLALRQQAAGAVRQLELALQLALQSLNSVKAFHDAAGTLDAEAFDRFVRSEARSHAGTLALGWAPRIGAAERAAFEAWLGSRSGRAEAIVEATGHGLRRVVANCDDCYPVQYLTALTGDDTRPGINLLSLPSRARAIAVALATGQPGATKARRSEAWGAEGDLVVQVFLPVREASPEPAEARVAGLAMGLFNASALLRQVFAAPPNAIDVALFDLDAPPVEQRLFTHWRDAGDARAGEPQAPDADTALRRMPGAVTHAFHVADRRWLALFAPPAGAARGLLVPLAGLLGGVLVTSLLAVYLFAALVRGQQLSSLSGRLDGAHRHLMEQELKVAFERGLREQAQASAGARHRFIQAASHDLRQPLHALALYLGLLQEQPARARDPGFMRRLQQSAAGLHGMFDVLLDWGRLESGQLEAEVRPFDLAPLVERLGEEAAALAASQGLRIVVRAVPTTVMSDPLLVERIVRNLLVNALRYTQRGWVALSVRRTPAGVELRVIDTGPGIAREARAQIFEPYVRGPRHIEGVGLGLAIVNMLARQLGHSLVLRSRVGRGSSFRLRLPAGVEGAATKSLVELDQPTQTPAARLSGLSVLLVDDEPEVRGATERLLRAWGAEVVGAASLAEAQRRVEARARDGHPFDLWLLDQQLPDGTGCGWLRRQCAASASRPPVLLITAAATPSLREDAAELDAVVLTKPLTALKLRSSLAAVLHDRLRPTPPR